MDNKKIECVYLRDKIIFDNLEKAIYYFDLEKENIKDLYELNETLKQMYEGMAYPRCEYW